MPIKPKPKTMLDNVIDEALREMTSVNVDSDEYKTMLKRVERLEKLRQNNKPQPLSRDTLAIVVGNLAGIAMIVGYERAHIVTSKAINFVVKAR